MECVRTAAAAQPQAGACVGGARRAAPVRITPDSSMPDPVARRCTRRRVIQALMTALVPPLHARAQDQPRTPAVPGEGWQSLFDGRTLGAWEPTLFGGEGVVHVDDGRIVLEQGNDLTGITWKGEVPATVGYELALEAMRVSGGDFFCGLTFPVGG